MLEQRRIDVNHVAMALILHTYTLFRHNVFAVTFLIITTGKNTQYEKNVQKCTGFIFCAFFRDTPLILVVAVLSPTGMRGSRKFSQL